jgi:hypothetical protein
LVPFAYGWGQEVHYIIGYIAGNLLPKWHARYIEDLFEYRTKGQLPIAELLASISADPDKKEYPYKEYEYYHYGHATPTFKTPWNYNTMCGHPKNPDKCVVRGIAIFSAMAGDINKTNPERAFAIEMLVHLMGDIHQPLHMGLWEDLGGLRIEDVWESYDPYISKNPNIKSHTHYNLHELWDIGLFRYYENVLLKLDDNRENEDPGKIHVKMDKWRILAESLLKQISQEFKQRMDYPGMGNLNVTRESEAQEFAAWIATESIKVVEQVAYKNEDGRWVKGVKPVPIVSEAYVRTRFEFMKSLLMRAGFRLARLLETIVEYSVGKEADEALAIIPKEARMGSVLKPTGLGVQKSNLVKPLSDRTNIPLPVAPRLVPNNYGGGMMEPDRDESTVPFQGVAKYNSSDESTRRGEDDK